MRIQVRTAPRPRSLRPLTPHSRASPPSGRLPRAPRAAPPGTASVVPRELRAAGSRKPQVSLSFRAEQHREDVDPRAGLQQVHGGRAADMHPDQHALHDSELAAARARQPAGALPLAYRYRVHIDIHRGVYAEGGGVWFHVRGERLPARFVEPAGLFGGGGIHHQPARRPGGAGAGRRERCPRAARAPLPASSPSRQVSAGAPAYTERRCVIADRRPDAGRHPAAGFLF
eukprot:COSAG04_NODE_1940_length_5169_cov_7.771006_1_plen_229_part_00